MEPQSEPTEIHNQPAEVCLYKFKGCSKQTRYNSRTKKGFGRFAVHEARLAAAIKAAPLVVLEIERWLDLSGTSELHLAKTPNGYE